MRSHSFINPILNSGCGNERYSARVSASLSRRNSSGVPPSRAVGGSIVTTLVSPCKRVC